MLWISFDHYNTASGRWLIWERYYLHGKPTILVCIRFRYLRIAEDSRHRGVISNLGYRIEALERHLNKLDATGGAKRDVERLHHTDPNTCIHAAVGDVGKLEGAALCGAVDVLTTLDDNMVSCDVCLSRLRGAAAGIAETRREFGI